MKVRLLLLALLFSASSLAIVPRAEAGTSFGGGIHYLRTLGDIKDAPDFDENDIGIIGSLAFSGSLARIEADLEVIPDYAGSSETMFQPQVYGLIGNFIYGGVGVGVGYLTGGFGRQDPFFALRAGVNLAFGGLDLDVFASYRFQKAKDITVEGVSDDLNAVTFGAIVWFGR